MVMVRASAATRAGVGDGRDARDPSVVPAAGTTNLGAPDTAPRGLGPGAERAAAAAGKEAQVAIKVDLHARTAVDARRRRSGTPAPTTPVILPRMSLHDAAFEDNQRGWHKR